MSIVFKVLCLVFWGIGLACVSTHKEVGILKADSYLILSTVFFVGAVILDKIMAFGKKK